MSIFTFGKHKGEDIEDVDTGYLQWFVSNIDPPALTGDGEKDKIRYESHKDFMSEIEDELASREKYGR